MTLPVTRALVEPKLIALLFAPIFCRFKMKRKAPISTMPITMGRIDAQMLFLDGSFKMIAGTGTPLSSAVS